MSQKSDPMDSAPEWKKGSCILSVLYMKSNKKLLTYVMHYHIVKRTGRPHFSSQHRMERAGESQAAAAAAAQSEEYQDNAGHTTRQQRNKNLPRELAFLHCMDVLPAPLAYFILSVCLVYG
ncbi:hypothetical protein XELAEV_18013108mg [Xenopus laevis]|uniref:Uncharacterized protein n=1 Tax=Xenopus laevis TaxID=8355 RepID=A0A974HZ30_XENLA|nr:hypothetical protein XELAEV_18013108mg [Xenopus laevis]